MKLAFSTLGCPDWTFEEIYATAKDLGLQGIEVRGIGKEMYAPLIKPFLPANIEDTKNMLKRTGLQVSMLTSSACLGNSCEDTEKYIAETKAYIDLAHILKTPFIRVLCSKNPEPDTEIDFELLASLYSSICEYGESRGVTPLIETNGKLAESSLMHSFLKSVKSSNNGVLWDIHHPYRYFGETPEQTISNLGDKIKYLHVKDSVIKDGKVQYRMMGYGNVPIFDAIRLLKTKGYEGYVALEWVKRWNPDLEEPGIALPHFVDYMRYLLK
jgi:sugar phosphate isomerase/epimerase